VCAIRTPEKLAVGLHLCRRRGNCVILLLRRPGEGGKACPLGWRPDGAWARANALGCPKIERQGQECRRLGRCNRAGQSRPIPSRQRPTPMPNDISRKGLSRRQTIPSAHRPRWPCAQALRAASREHQHFSACDHAAHAAHATSFCQTSAPSLQPLFCLLLPIALTRRIQLLISLST
jgi:hypothetical protein